MSNASEKKDFRLELKEVIDASFSDLRKRLMLERNAEEKVVDTVTTHVDDGGVTTRIALNKRGITCDIYLCKAIVVLNPCYYTKDDPAFLAIVSNYVKTIELKILEFESQVVLPLDSFPVGSHRIVNLELQTHFNLSNRNAVTVKMSFWSY
jgi:hypothetical protein